MTQIIDEREGKASASSFERRVFCPGSHHAEAACPVVSEETELSSRGVAIHEALETDDDSGLKLNDKIVKDRIRAIEDEAIEAWMSENNLERKDVTILREQRVWIRKRKMLEKLVSARLDCAAVAEHRKKALIIDAKTGFLDTTPAEANWQLRVQAVALWHEYNFEITDIVAAIASGRGKSKFDPVNYNSETLPWAEGQILFYNMNSLDPDSPRVPGLWCRYCRARGSCREAATFAILPIAVVKPAAAVKTDKKDIAARVDMLDHASLARIHSVSNIASAIFEAVKDRLKSLVKDELAAVGLELVPNSPMRTIADIQKAYYALSSRELCNEEEFRSMCKLSIGAVEEMLTIRLQEYTERRTGLKITKDEAKKELGTLLECAIERKPKAPSLKPLKSVK